MLDKRIVGKNLANYRKKKEITQKELAERLNITAQSVSKWEAGLSLPTVEMLYNLSVVLDVNIDSLLSDRVLDNRDIDYMETGLDVGKLYALKAEVDAMVTPDPNLLYAHYIDPLVFRIDLEELEDPVFALITNVPGSKARLARERGYDREICLDVAARAFNHVLRMGLMPRILQAHVVCGDKDSEQLRRMAASFKETCEQNDVCFGGMEIACQPVNFNPYEYEVSVGVVGAGERSKLLFGDQVEAGDVLIGMMTEGIDSCSYPFVRTMLERRPQLVYEKIDEQHYFVDEILKPNAAFTHAVRELQGAGILHGVCRVENSILNTHFYDGFSEKLGVCIDLSAFPVKPLFRFLQGLDMVGKNAFLNRFGMGIGMTVIVPETQAQRAMELIGKYHECHRIGRIENNAAHQGKRVWTEGKIRW